MKQTRLNSCHRKLKGKMIEFFGWKMPLEFSGIIEEHMAVRTKAGLFDVSHMGEILISDSQALEFVQYLTPNNVARLAPVSAQYSALTTPQGTFVDDLLVYCLSEKEYLLVVNAANTDKDYEWIRSHAKGFNVVVQNQSSAYSQLALQGPKSADILQQLTEIDLREMKIFGGSFGKVAGVESIVSRTGYTGEDGFEIYTVSSRPDKIWNAILEMGKSAGVLPVGLGARDTLRLEAALMLYGNDIDENVTVLEAGLGWLIKFKKGDFLGKAALLKQKESGFQKRISGFELIDKGIARSHFPVFIDGKHVSDVCSGTFSPCLKKSIGLTYLPLAAAEIGAEFEIGIREKKARAQVVPLPFYKKADTQQ